MKLKVKFIFYLKSGKVFDTVVEMTQEEFLSIVDIIKESFSKEGKGYICLVTCLVNLNECAVVDWEELK